MKPPEKKFVAQVGVHSNLLVFLGVGLLLKDFKEAFYEKKFSEKIKNFLKQAFSVPMNQHEGI